MSISKVPKEAFDSGLLNLEFHDRLLLDLDRITRHAGVPVSAVWSHLSQYCAGPDYEWVRNMRASEDAGLMFVGKKPVPVEDKMMAIAGACLRNYLDARVMSVQEVLKSLKDNTMPSPTLLLIPNFCHEKDNGGDIPTWESSNLLGLLLQRQNAGKKTVLHCSSLQTLEKAYGNAIREHVEKRYTLH